MLECSRVEEKGSWIRLVWQAHPSREGQNVKRRFCLRVYRNCKLLFFNKGMHCNSIEWLCLETSWKPVPCRGNAFCLARLPWVSHAFVSVAQGPSWEKVGQGKMALFPHWHRLEICQANSLWYPKEDEAGPGSWSHPCAIFYWQRSKEKELDS